MLKTLAAVLTLWSLLLVPVGQSAPAQVGPEQAAYQISPGEDTLVTVMLENAVNVYGIDVTASFDPRLVEVVDDNPNRDGVQLQPGQFPQPDFIARQDVNPQTGVLHYTITQVNPTQPATGSGVLFAVRLRGRGVAGTGEFRIDRVEMSTRDGELLPVQGSAAILEVTGNANAQPTGIVLNATAQPHTPVATVTAAMTVTGSPSAPTPQATSAVSAPVSATVASPATAVATLTGAVASGQAASVSATAEPAGGNVAPMATLPPDTTDTVPPEAAPADPLNAITIPIQPDSSPPAIAASAVESSPSDSSVAANGPAVIGDGQSPAASPGARATPLAAEPTNHWPILLIVGAGILVAVVAYLVVRRSS